jgi:hypothetical protein
MKSAIDVMFCAFASRTICRISGAPTVKAMIGPA